MTVTATDVALDAAERLLAELPPSAAVWCSGLRKRYGRQTAVDDVSFTVGRGEIVGLLGPNGAGKTSVIKILLGLVRPDAGEVLLLGRPAPRPAVAGPRRLPAGALPVPAVAHGRRGADAARPARGRRGVRPRNGASAWPPSVSPHRAGDRVGGFSKGMQQRLGLAVALVARPELVVLDEPTSALDPIGRADVRDLLLSLRDRGVAVLLNSHLIGEVERVCDRVVILDKGRVAASGTLAELLGRRELRLRLEGVRAEAEERLAAAGRLTGSGELVHGRAGRRRADATTVPDLVADLVALGVRVHAVEPVPDQPRGAAARHPPRRGRR